MPLEVLTSAEYRGRMTSLVLLTTPFLIQARTPLAFLGALSTVHQHTKVPFHQAAFQPQLPKPVGLPGVVVTKMQDPTLGSIETHAVNPDPSIQSIQVPLSCPSPLRQINTPSQLGVICKLIKGALNPFIEIVNKDVK